MHPVRVDLTMRLAADTGVLQSPGLRVIGAQPAFYADPRVLTISLHESGFALFPGTGFPEDVGTGQAEGTAVNVALPSYTGDAGWLRAYSGVVPVLVEAFEPDVLVTQCGC